MIINFLPYNNEIYRKLIHSASALIPLLYIFINFKVFICIIALALIITLYINLNYTKYLSKIYIFKKIFGHVLRPYEINHLWGSSYMLIGFFFITLLFNKYIAIPAMLITSISDSLAAVFGMKYGQIKVINNKTLEGLLAFIISAYIILFLFLNNYPILLLYFISIIAGLIELFTPTKFDNISIPIGIAVILYIISSQV